MKLTYGSVILICSLFLIAQTSNLRDESFYEMAKKKASELISSAEYKLNDFVHTNAKTFEELMEKAKRTFYEKKERLADYAEDKWDDLKDYVKQLLKKKQEGEKEKENATKIANNY